MTKFKTIIMLSLLTMLVLKDILLVNFNNNLLGKISLIALTVYSFFHNKMVGVALTFLYVILSLNIVEAMEEGGERNIVLTKGMKLIAQCKGDNKKKNKANVPKNDMGNWRKTHCKKGKLLLNGTPIKKDPKDYSAFLKKDFPNQLTFDNKKEDLCNPCDVSCTDYKVSTKKKSQSKGFLNNLEKEF